MEAAARRSRTRMKRILTPFQHFARLEAAAGLVLLASTLVALAWANSPWSDTYFHAREIPLRLGLAGRGMTEAVHAWINDGLMVVFFLLVGLEIKREALQGELSGMQRALLPLAGAAGGMLLPAALYLAASAGGSAAAGWAIPMATDIAFALGVLALLGRGMPASARIFLTALAIADDIGAVVVIALFFTAGIHLAWIAAAATLVLVLAGMNVLGLRRPWAYALVGVLLWLAVLRSGLHATLAGVALAAMVPARPRPGEQDTPLQRMENGLHGWVAFGIIPLFALANAGVDLRASGLASLLHPVTRGILLGLVVGKPLGILLATWAATGFGRRLLPEGLSWRALLAIAPLGGIGFTMSLFVATLAFGDDARMDAARLGILAASGLAALLGWVGIRLHRRGAPDPGMAGPG